MKREFAWVLGAAALLACVAAVVLTQILWPQERSKDYLSLDEQRERDLWMHAPTVTVIKHQLLVDGAPAGTLPAPGDSDQLRRLDALYEKLLAKRKLFEQLFPGKPFPGSFVLQAGAEVPPAYVEAIRRTARDAGYVRHRRVQE
ncbi:MAG TPA: hypothetical protein PKA88_15490 [Polyangiaceae bacterium]|nr:hypothetical protein [Polyangiaceae bacterium]